MGTIGSYEVDLRRSDGTRTRVELDSRVLGPREILLMVRDLAPHQRESRLLTALAGVAAQVQRARTVASVLREAAEGLFSLGFQVAVVSAQGTIGHLAYVAANPELRALVAPFLSAPFPLHSLPGVLEALRDRGGVYLDDVLADASARGLVLEPSWFAYLRQQGLSKLAVAPVLIQGEAWGVFCVSATVLGSQEAAAVNLFTAQVASALEVAQSIEALERQNQWLAAVHRLVHEANDAREPELVARLLPLVIEATKSDGAAVYRVDSETNTLVIAGDLGGAPEWFRTKYRRLSLPGSTTGDIAQTLQPKRLGVDDWPVPLQADVRRAGLVESAILPLQVKGRLEGTLNLMRRSPNRYSDDELKSASIMAAQLAVQLERARLFADLQHGYEALEQAQQDLVKSERLAALGELAAVIAHEVRNPLGVIFNSLASLRRYALPGEAQKLLEFLGEESDRLNRLVGDLLDFARPHQPELHGEPLAEVVAEALESAARGVALPRVDVNLALASDLPMVLIDGPLMHQVVLNLVLNAIQAMPSGGTLTIAAEHEPEPSLRVRLDVTDTGPGFSPELADRIFEPFFTTKATGTGLGLAVVKRILDAHRAQFGVRSTPGVGTTFSVWLTAASLK